MFGPGDWVYSTAHKQGGRVVDAQSLWGQTVYRVWFWHLDKVLRVRAGDLRPASANAVYDPAQIAYTAAAARVADALAQDVMLAPIGSSVIPLPHQMLVLSRAISGERIRYLLADEVGLGKTIEAGLILRELKLRGLIHRTLVVAPKGLVRQWAAEMRTHFGEDFRPMSPADFPALRRVTGDGNLWKLRDQVICSMDSIKPLEKRRGWSAEEIAEHNRERFADLIAAGWDLIVVDEAHRLGGSSGDVARVKLGRALSEAAPYFLMLSATPHQGKSDAFQRLLSLLDREAFPDTASVTRERVAPFVIRTEKRQAIDADGAPLFKPRYTRLMPVRWEPRHRAQEQLYAAVSEYVRVGYNQAMRQKRNYVGFLLLLLQRLVTSSTRAIRVTLERRLEALRQPEEQLSLFPETLEEDWEDLDTEEQIDAFLKTRLKALKNERAEVEFLLETARRTEAAGADAKAETLLAWIYEIRQQESSPDLKLLIFTEFVPTQDMLKEFLGSRGFHTVCLNGRLTMEERLDVQKEFANGADVLISTEAGGEGLNLQFCHVVVNYDIPWNPMRLEQRIGRVDRIGQKHAVRAVNLVLEETVEFRVREVLEQKLAVILQEFGVDKTGDVLDSPEVFEEMYVEALMDPATTVQAVDAAMGRLRQQAQSSRLALSLLRSEEKIDPDAARRMIDHPLPHWVERMTVQYLTWHGCGPRERTTGPTPAWDLRWPDGKEMKNVVFVPRDAAANPSATYLTLEDPRIRDLVQELPRHVPGQPIPRLRLRLPAGVSGLWSLWRVANYASDMSRHVIMPIFLHRDGRVLPPTARHIWDQLLAQDVVIEGIDSTTVENDLSRLTAVAEEHAQPLYSELVRVHRRGLDRERQKGEYAFGVRREAASKIGLPAVREHRTGELQQEYEIWRRELERKSEVDPELIPIVVAYVG